MPLYDFKCHMCGHEWEELVSRLYPLEKQVPNCPACTSIEFSRLTSIPYVGNTARQKTMDKALRHGASSPTKTKVYINKEQHGTTTRRSRARE